MAGGVRGGWRAAASECAAQDLIVGVGADPIGRVLAEAVVRGVALDAGEELEDGLTPPVGDEPHWRLGAARHDLHV